MRVLISGAGVAGPTLAWFLAKTGARVDVVEKAKELLPHGQNVDIEGSALKVIQKMGLLEEVKRNNTTEKGTQFIDPNGKPFAPFPMVKDQQASFTSEFEILRGDLAAILTNAARDFDNVKYHFDTIVKNVISNDEKSVKVELSNGDVREYDLLVAADGQWSKVRKQCFPAESIKPLDKGMFAAYWTCPRIPCDNDWWNIYIAQGSRLLTLRPDPHGTTRAMISRMPLDEAQKKAWLSASRAGKEAQQELIASEFSDAGWQAERIIASMKDAPDFYFQSLQQIRMDKWSIGRVICLGDTAYAPTPLTGMGTTLALTGAHLLAGELSKLEEGEHPKKAFEAYESSFRPWIEKQQDIPWFVPGVAHPSTPFKRWIFNTCIATISAIVGRVIATPWIMKRIKGEEAHEIKEDFPLPQYPALEGQTVKV